MARYFNYFPKTLYTLDKKKSALDTVTNITARFSFEESLKDNSTVFYTYDLKEGDTPEIVASKYYGNPEKHWIILLFNNIVDAQFDWPLDGRALNEFVDKKYSVPQYADTANTSDTGLAWAKTTPHSYFKIVTETTQDKISITKLEVDANTYANDTIMETGTNEDYRLQDGTTVNIVISKEEKTYFDYELEKNEDRRKIKLLKPEFVATVEKDFKKAVKQ